MKTKKFINNPENLTPELLEGLTEVHKELVTLGENHMIINNKLAEANKVTTVTQGGSGHEPAISGSMGEGMADIPVVGDAFVVPELQACLDAMELADKGKGVLYIILNRVGDILTGNLTMKKRAKEGLNVVKVVTQKDIVDTPHSNADDRRGLVECIPTYKIAGAVTAEGKSLEEVAAITWWLVDSMATLAVTVSGATRSTIGSLLADLDEDEMKVGIGQHGEGGGERQTMRPADETAKIMLNGPPVDLDTRKGGKIMLISNETGATTLMKLFIIYRKYVSHLRERSIETMANYVGEFLIVQEQAGFQMLMAGMDDELLYY